jgi:hypothetical protein
MRRTALGCHVHSSVCTPPHASRVERGQTQGMELEMDMEEEIEASRKLLRTCAYKSSPGSSWWLFAWLGSLVGCLAGFVGWLVGWHDFTMPPQCPDATFMPH